MRLRAPAFGALPILAALIAGTPASVHAQGVKPTPATGELKTVLYNWANSMGMLRGIQEIDAITTLLYWGTGTINVGGQPCRLTDYRGSLNYQETGMRVEIACTRADGKPHKEIQVVAGKFAWNEEKPGIGPAPSMAALNERLIQYWSSPQGAVKAARAASDAKLTVEGGKTVVTFPIPGVSGATAKATLSAKNQAERVEARLGARVIEWTYSDYADLNGSDYKADAFFPRRIIQKEGPLTMLDLTVTKTDTINPYVIMPVPESLEKTQAAR